MLTHYWAKLGGWGAFLLILAANVTGYLAHGTAPNFGEIGSSLVAAAGIHAASSTDGTH